MADSKKAFSFGQVKELETSIARLKRQGLPVRTELNELKIKLLSRHEHHQERITLYKKLKESIRELIKQETPRKQRSTRILEPDVGRLPYRRPYNYEKPLGDAPVGFWHVGRCIRQDILERSGRLMAKRLSPRWGDNWEKPFWFEFCQFSINSQNTTSELPLHRGDNRRSNFARNQSKIVNLHRMAHGEWSALGADRMPGGARPPSGQLGNTHWIG